MLLQLQRTSEYKQELAKATASVKLHINQEDQSWFRCEGNHSGNYLELCHQRDILTVLTMKQLFQAHFLLR